MDTTQPVHEMELDVGDEDLSRSIKQPVPDELDEFQQIVPMPKEMILITLIAKEPALFNPKHSNYRNPLKRDDLWIQIANRVGWKDEHCRSKWKAMRDQYCRELKRARMNPNVVIKWKYFEQLDFLRPFALYRNYRPKMSTKAESEKESQHEQEANVKQESPVIKEDKLSPSLKTENWNTSSYSNSSQINDSADITSQIMDQISQSEINEEIDEEQQDDDEDEDDDPIHTFLNIESYFENELITLIQSKPMLYNHQHPYYRNPKFKLAVWEEIARKLKKTVRQCRLKWKALRDQYMREHKRLIFLNDKDMPRWKHYDALAFLEKHVRTKSVVDREFKNMSPLELSIDQLEHRQLPSAEDDHEMTQYIIESEDNTQVFADCGNSRQSAEEEPLDYIEHRVEEHPSHTKSREDKRVEVCTQKSDIVEMTTNSPAAMKDDSDEVGAFFRAIAIKIRKAKMSDLAFTELQIDILRVINTALRDH